METTNILVGEQMRFILNDRVFDTESSRVVAVNRGEYQPGSEFDKYFPAQNVRFEEVLYRTKKGSFFVHEHHTIKHAKGKPVVSDNAYELESGVEAVQWIAREVAVIIDGTGLPLPDEA